MWAFLIGCAVLLVVGCSSGVRLEGSQEEQGHTEATKEQEHSDRCAETRTLDLQGAVYTTNDVPGCPNGGLLSGTDEADTLTGEDGEDEVRGFGAADEHWGGLGSDVMYGGSGDDFLTGSTVNENNHDTSKDVLHGGRAVTMWSACGAMTGSTGPYIYVQLRCVPPPQAPPSGLATLRPMEGVFFEFRRCGGGRHGDTRLDGCRFGPVGRGRCEQCWIT